MSAGSSSPSATNNPGLMSMGFPQSREAQIWGILIPAAAKGQDLPPTLPRLVQ